MALDAGWDEELLKIEIEELQNLGYDLEYTGFDEKELADLFGVDEKEVVETANFANDLGADSLDTVELIMELEKEFNISIPEDAAEKISTVGDAIKFIEEAKAN